MEINAARADLKTYQNLADEGSFVKKGKDDSDVRATGRSGKLGQVTKWMAKRNASDNRELKEQFLRDISQTFGEEFAQKVRGDVNPEGRSPLSANKINRVFAQARQDFGDAKVDRQVATSSRIAEFTQLGEGSELLKLIQTTDPNFFAGDPDSENPARDLATNIGNEIELASEKKGSALTQIETAQLTRMFVLRDLKTLPSVPQSLGDCFVNGDLEGAKEKLKTLAQMVNVLSRSDSAESSGISRASQLLNLDLEGLSPELTDQFSPLIEFGATYDVDSLQRDQDLSTAIGNFIREKVGEEGSTFSADIGLTSSEESNLRNQSLSELTSVFQQMTTRLPMMMDTLIQTQADYDAAKTAGDSDREARKLNGLKSGLTEFETLSTTLKDRVEKYSEVMQTPGFIGAIPAESRPAIRDLADTLQSLNTRFQGSDSMMDEIAIFARTQRSQLPEN